MTIENHKSRTEVRHGLREDDREAEISVLAGIHVGSCRPVRDSWPRFTIVSSDLDMRQSTFDYSLSRFHIQNGANAKFRRMGIARRTLEQPPHVFWRRWFGNSQSASLD
ncbi:hypothetical protein [Pararobbsia alpina]|uniref:Uncharacterized protein n=1 Tax=Pararobbsia alpina TaxID=621374 RepID=A0A6S7BGL6_9BURK|nr:hypothetical protein [Pararobbsia alpina]CAB3790583.1 hypothetical protein LMG28138_03017 [Pararobbsia alpina]